MKLPALLLALAASAAWSPAQTPPVAAPAPAPAAVGRDIVDLYDQAVASLEVLCDDYRRIRAIQLSRQRDISVEEAYDAIASVMPALEPIARDLLRRALRDPADIAVHKREVNEVEKQIEMMVELAARLLDEIERVRMELEAMETEQPETTLEEIVRRETFDPDRVVELSGERREQEAPLQELERLAREDPVQPARDLVEAMARVREPDMRDLTREELQAGRTVDLMTVAALAGMRGAVDLERLSKVMGRGIAADGTPAEWLFVDTWYTIGPFPNPQRRNIHRKFPPETVVDLDAVYEGKDGRMVRWQWTQSGQPKCTPADDEEYAIYYAYTEIYLEEAQDLWVAIGSDDKANVWLNGLPIWISGDQLKGWRPNEGFRRVRFEAGLNRILYRVENGWLQTAFSLAIRTRE